MKLVINHVRFFCLHFFFIIFIGFDPRLFKQNYYFVSIRILGYNYEPVQIILLHLNTQRNQCKPPFVPCLEKYVKLHKIYSTCVFLMICNTERSPFCWKVHTCVQKYNQWYRFSYIFLGQNFCLIWIVLFFWPIFSTVRIQRVCVNVSVWTNNLVSISNHYFNFYHDVIILARAGL